MSLKSTGSVACVDRLIKLTEGWNPTGKGAKQRPAGGGKGGGKGKGGKSKVLKVYYEKGGSVQL